MERNSQLGYGGHKKSKKHSQKVLDPMSGKRQKSLKGHSSGFSSDYPHAMETMDDSEGLGSSGRIDTGLGASELYNVGRKSISLNDDRSGVFGVPLRVFSLPKLRRSERKELKLRLKAELEQVQVLSKKIAVRSTNGVAFSSASIIHNCNDGPKMPPNQSFQRSSQNMPVPAKKHGSSGQTNGASLKRDTSGRFNCITQGTPVSTSHVMLMKQCASLLQSLMSHQMGMGGIFNAPVDIVKFNIPDYFTVIQHPMDLGTVKKKLASGNYSSPFEFCADVKLTFSNAMTYNPPGNQVHNSAAKLKEYFELRWKSIEKKLLANKSKSVQSKSSAVGELEVAKAMPPAKKRKVSSIEHKVKPDIVKLVMTEEEKLKLTRDLEPLIADLPVHIANFLREHTYNATQTGDDEIEIDIEDLSDEVLLTLRKLVDDHLREMQLNQEKAEPCEMEVLNESGLSNSSMQPCKGNTIVDEDVDIGGNDPPVSSYPPVEIEKDGAHKKNKCSSSSSSSSDSGSSSSDSDSGSSSGSESHGAKISSPAARIKETVGSDEVLDQKTSDLIDPNDGNQAVSGLDQLEQTSQPRTGSTEADSCQDGEIAPSERQASPDKLYRAALLRSRFADTILKAREKTLVQGEKGDPEKLRREREKLERQQREEKARLQAEARAAEDARKQAEAEYAVEAKRKREVEREAARQALLKMEKSVEINENRQFLEELEMLTVAPAENLPSSVDETSPIHSEDGMGGFKLQGCTNPLEQLGLYMKEEEEEEEEEEEVEPNTIQDPLTDVEEGEID